MLVSHDLSKAPLPKPNFDTLPTHQPHVNTTKGVDFKVSRPFVKHIHVCVPELYSSTVNNALEVLLRLFVHKWTANYSVKRALGRERCGSGCGNAKCICSM